MEAQNTSRHYTLEQLGDGVYVALARVGGAAIGNAGLVDLGDSTLVIDSFLTPTAAEDLRNDAKRVTGRVPSHVINTHYHNDHIWGNQAFLPEAQIISTVETRMLIQSAGKEEYDYYRTISEDRLKKLLAKQAYKQSEPITENDTPDAAIDLMIGFFSGMSHDFPRLSVTLPNMVFENRMVIYGSRRRAELVAFSGAHTGSDLVVYLPEDGILFMSDLLFSGHHAYLGDGNPMRWKDVLRSILDGSAGIRDVSRFVPGHGMVSTQVALQRMIEYIEDCYKTAISLAADQKISHVDISSTTIPEQYAHWTMPVFFYANLQFFLDQLAEAAEGSRLSKKSKLTSNSFRP